MQVRLRLVALIAVALAGCDVPKDPDSTLEVVRGGTLRVGILPGNPDAERQDRDIVAGLAAALGATAEFRAADSHALIDELKAGELHLVIGGVPASTPFLAETALSRPAGPLFRPAEDKERVLAAPQGENGFLLQVNQAIHEHRVRGGI